MSNPWISFPVGTPFLSQMVVVFVCRFCEQSLHPVPASLSFCPPDGSRLHEKHSVAFRFLTEGLAVVHYTVSILSTQGNLFLTYVAEGELIQFGFYV